MSTKNLLDNASGRPAVFSDLTGKVTYEPRGDLAETLVFLHQAYAAMTAADKPKVHAFSFRFAVSAMCYHMGWLPYEVAAAEQYVAAATETPATTVG
jgi:hypothetical protein